VTGNAKLAHQKGIERGVEGLGDLGGDRDASARQTQDDHIGLIDVGNQLRRELTAGVMPVTKWEGHTSCPSFD
jgi:hypothetical protein